MSSKINPVYECQICFDTYETDKIRDLKCWSKDNDHIICVECFDKESNRRKEMGIKNPNECFICKPFQENIENITINSINHITIVNNSIYNTRSLRCENCLFNIHACFILCILYIIFILNWHAYRIILFFIKEGEYLDENINWNPLNVFYALFVDFLVYASCYTMIERSETRRRYL